MFKIIMICHGNADSFLEREEKETTKSIAKQYNGRNTAIIFN